MNKSLNAIKEEYPDTYNFLKRLEAGLADIGEFH